MNLWHLSVNHVPAGRDVPAPLSNADRIKAFRHLMVEHTEPVIGNVRLWMLLRKREAELMRRVEGARSIA